MHVVAAKAVSFKEALDPSFKTYAAQILKNMKAMEAVLHERNVRMITGGTSNHLILADAFGSLGVSGREAQDLLDGVGVTLNKNSIADDPRGPMDPSGIRFGAAAITTRGFTEKESAQVARLMLDALVAKDDAQKLASIREEVQTLSRAFPIPDSFI